jgi:hypothetical protein
MTELERIKNIEERIALARLLPGVNLGCLPLEEAAKLKRAALDLYRLGHANGFKAGADHAKNEAASVTPARRDALLIQWLRRWQEFKKLLRSSHVAVIWSPRRRRFPTEALSGNWEIRR